MNGFFSFKDPAFLANYSCDDLPNPADFKMHTHESCELYCFIDGKGVFRIEGVPYPLEYGDILIMRPAESHYIDISADQSYTRLSLHFRPDIFKGLDPSGDLFAPFFLREPGSFNCYRAHDFKTPAYRTFLNNIITETENRRLQILTNLLALLNEIAVAFQNKTDQAVSHSLDRRIISYVNDNLSQSISLDVISKKFFISKPQLCRIFKNATGSTIWDYITVKRLVTAKELIQSGLSPTQIYGKCGFNDYSVFYRAYKKKYGVSPRENLPSRTD